MDIRHHPRFRGGRLYLWTDEGWLYLAIVLDLFNREVVGWSLKPRMTADTLREAATSIVTDALTMAWFRRKPAPGVMHNEDRGSQYASHAFQGKLTEYGMICSMSRKGNCWEREACPRGAMRRPRAGSTASRMSECMAGAGARAKI